MYYTVSHAGFLLGVCPTTIRRWDRKKQIQCIRTTGGHRRIHKDEIERIIKGKKRKRGVAIYARVSSHDQKKKGILDRQQEKLRDYCTNNNLKIVSELKDVASGYQKKRNKTID